MRLWTSEVIPIDNLLRGEKIEFGKIFDKAKQKPGYFALELLSLALMVIGAITAGEWMFRLGYTIGSSY